ncbi:hypothetical protein [Rhizobium herbae]|uniref:Uncharacterized protein with ACT and thioredoxin-like domain n=1 Tax=Rhizobium herbae TaxID=508661 RepID=A0ABS4ESI3_9HYPH|nr:hypothetical protein [Rhizobium herbae]MBP1860911.1 uncharacterized protein with ACT and thioredoxin-like domain [Rhizobium herbae]
MPHPTVVEFIDAIRSRSSSVVLVGSGFVEFADVVHESGSYVDVILADHLGRITYYQGGFADYEIIDSDGEQLVWEHIERIDEIEQLVERFNKLCSAVNAYAQARPI